MTDLEIQEHLGISVPTIARVRQRCVTEGLAAALDHRPQPPRPEKVKIKGDVEQKLIRLACSDPPQGRCRWTLCLLSDELVALGLLPSVSRETVRQVLKKIGAERPAGPLHTERVCWTWVCEEYRGAYNCCQPRPPDRGPQNLSRGDSFACNENCSPFWCVPVAELS